MKILKKMAVILLIVLLPVTMLLTDVQLVAYDRGYYKSEYARYGVAEHIGMSMDNLMESTEQLLLYLENKRNDLNFRSEFVKGPEEFFSPRDKQHMVDVKGLFIKGHFIRNLSFLYIICFLWLYLRRKDRTRVLPGLAKYGLASSIAGIAPVLLLVSLMSIDFYKYFTIFHEIFFTNDLWLLDPAVDRLVNIFPEAFFTDMAFRIAYLYIAEMAVLLIGSLLMLRYGKTKSVRGR